MTSIDIDGEPSAHARGIYGREPITAGRSGLPGPGSSAGELIDRIEKLRILLSAFAHEIAAARREAALLRSQNAELKAALTKSNAASTSPASSDNDGGPNDGDGSI